MTADSYRTEVARKVADFERAVSDGDLRAATEHALAIEAADPDLLAALRDLRDAVADEDDGRARTLAVTVERVTDRRLPGRRVASERADHVAAALTPASNAARTLSTLSGEATAVEGALGSLLPTAELLLARSAEDRRRATRLRAVEDADRAIEAVRTFRAVREEADAVLAELDPARPPKAVLAAVRPDSRSFLAGTTETITVDVANVGDRPATEVALAATAPDDGPFRVQQSEHDVGTLPPGERATVTVTLAADAAGAGDLLVDLTSADAGEDAASRRLTVYDEPPTLGAVYDRDDDRILDTDEVQSAVADYVEDDPAPNTDQQLDAEEVRRLVRWWATDDPVGGGV